MNDMKNKKCRLCKHNLIGVDFVFFYGYRCHLRCVDQFKEEEKEWNKFKTPITELMDC